MPDGGFRGVIRIETCLRCEGAGCPSCEGRGAVCWEKVSWDRIRAISGVSPGVLRHETPVPHPTIHRGTKPSENDYTFVSTNSTDGGDIHR